MTQPRRDDQLRRLVAARSRAVREGVTAESMSTDEAEPPGADEVTNRVRATLEQRPAEEIGDPREFRRALDVLLRTTQRAARKLDNNPAAALSPDEAGALEAVSRTDGTRPTLLVRDDTVDPSHPLAGDWSDTLAATQDVLRNAIRAIGRIEPTNATSRNFFGTGWVVDGDRGLVLTNQHVLDAMWRRLPHAMARTATGFRVHDGAVIDFAAESGSSRTRRFRIVEATPSTVDGPGFARLDVAVLRIDPDQPEEVIPDAVPVLADPDGPRGNLGSFCVVGFPGPPRFISGLHEGVDWRWVNATLFGNRYGVKRLAPGNAHRPLGMFSGDGRQWVFGHDATTLGGNSGSPVLAWGDGAFGLHFAGASVDTNCAHAVSASAEELRTLGVPIT